MSAFTYSPEQTAIFDLKDKSGSFTVIANAGSGKTESSGELVVRIYQKLEKQLFPDAKEHVTGENQIKILEQILVVTFTRKAASELDARIKKKFAAIGIPSPTRYGKDYIICRTLDSFLQRWITKPIFFETWLKFDKDWANCMERIYDRLSPAAKEVIAKDNNGQGNPLHRLFRRWDRLIVGSRQTALIDLVVRMEFDQPPLPGWSLTELVARFEEFKAKLDPSKEVGWKLGFLDDLASAFDAHESSMRELLRRKQAHVSGGAGKQVVPLTAAEEVQLDSWSRHIARRDEFTSIYEIARSRGYDPIRDPSRIGNYDVINVVCGSKHYEHLRPIHSMALGYRKVKRIMGLMDFGDHLQVFTQVITSKEGRILLETDKEFPKMGFRRRVVIWDEVQDNNPPQFTVLRNFVTKLSEKTGQHAPFLSLAVGDPFQSLYEFRGASPYQFVNSLEEARVLRPETLLGLTCSFRSAKSIVRLGNSIISTMSTFAENAKPSRTVYKEEGTITIAPPMHTQEEEAQWVLNKIDHLRNTEGGHCMVVIRAGLESHPLFRRWGSKPPEGVTFMTIHASKGLEADHVFVVGLTAGKFPDVRGSMEQEVNAFYVACTRPRRNLFLTAPMVTTVEKSDGTTEDVLVGPSIFLVKVPELKKIALSSGWTEANLRMGLDTHSAGQAAYIRDIEKKRPQLLAEAKNAFGATALPEVRSTKYLGAISNYQDIPLERRLPPPEKPAGAKIQVTPELTTLVEAKLRKCFFKNGQPAQLSYKERAAGLQLGWIRERSGNLEFTPEFKTKLRTPPPAAVAPSA